MDDGRIPFAAIRPIVSVCRINRINRSATISAACRGVRAKGGVHGLELVAIEVVNRDIPSRPNAC